MLRLSYIEFTATIISNNDGSGSWKKYIRSGVVWVERNIYPYSIHGTVPSFSFPDFLTLMVDLLDKSYCILSLTHAHIHPFLQD